LKKHGLTKEDKTRGDLYVVIEVVMPKEITAKERELWEKLAAESKEHAK
jgi:DnaJ-class molecular chaperone